MLTETGDHEPFLSKAVSDYKIQWQLWCAMIYFPHEMDSGNKDECSTDSALEN